MALLVLNSDRLTVHRDYFYRAIQVIVSSVQTLKNALSPYRLGGASGGSDFDPKGKSDNEVLSSLVKLFADVPLICLVSIR